MLLSLIAGAMADNLDRRKVMLGAQIFMLVVSVALMVCAWTGLITPWLLLLFTFLIGCGGAFNAPAWQASVGDMVPRAELPGAVALNSMGFNIARSVGPAIGGAHRRGGGSSRRVRGECGELYRADRRARALAPATASASAAARDARHRDRRGHSLRRDVARHSHACCSAAQCSVSAASAVMALMPLVAKVLLGGGPLTYGLLLGAFGVGAVAGAIGNARLRQVLSTEAIVRWASIAFAVAAAIVGLSNHLLATMAGLFVAGAGWVLALATFNVAVQMSAPRWVVARALSLYQMAAFSGLAAGSWLWGDVAASVSVRAALLAASVVMLACAALGRWLPLAQTEELNLDLLRLWKEPSTAVPVEPRTGPVVITIEYVIRQDDIVEFLAAMAERRRIRRRDGARNWRLLRDLADPQLWIERYETPTWLDYVRHNSRMTHHDAIDSGAPSRTAPRTGRSSRPTHDRTSVRPTCLGYRLPRR